MCSAVTVKDAQDLRKLIPLNILSASRFEKLCAEISIEEVPRGSLLFSQGDAKNEFVYVLSGTISLQAGGTEMETISAGTESARFALAHQIPRKVSAVAKDKVRYIRVDSAYVNQPNENTAGGVATYEVSDIPEDSAGDWVATLLKSPIFQRLPPANLQNILSILEEVPVKAGQEIIHQDEPGDYYYVIKQGRCALTRKPSTHAREIKLAELKTCDTFGEDSLISDQPRNVTVTMMTDGVLLRLNKDDFLKLVKEPVIAYVSMESARRIIPQAGVWLDVRTPDAFEGGHLLGAINIPFFKLRMELANLNRQQKYVLVCETGRVSESAAFLLIRHLFDAYVLRGGISAVFPDQLVCGADSGALAIREQVETPGTNAPIEVGQHTHRGGGVTEKNTQAVMGPAADETQLREALDALESLGRDNRALKVELANAHEAFTELQAEFKKSQSVQSDLRDQLRTVNAEAIELRAQSQVLAEELRRLRDERPNVASAEKVAAMDSRLAEMETARRQLESDLKAVLEEKTQLERQLRAMEEKTQAQRVSAQGEGELFRKKLQSLEELNSRVEREKQAADARIKELEQQVAELRVVVQEFVDHQPQTLSDEVESLSAELETVRAQATDDVMAMQGKLRGAEQEVARLKGELESAHGQLLMREVDRQGCGTSRRGPSQTGNSLQALLGKIAYALLMAGIGAALLIAVVAGTEVGHQFTQKLLGQSTPSSPDSSPSIPM